jgi:ABC-type nitrate/sulfonate/bicarbonate transport system permease component
MAQLSRQRWLSPVVLILIWEMAARAGVIPTRVDVTPLWDTRLNADLETA